MPNSGREEICARVGQMADANKAADVSVYGIQLMQVATRARETQQASKLQELMGHACLAHAVNCMKTGFPA